MSINKKMFFIFLLLIFAILSLSAVSAADFDSNDTVSDIYQYDSVSSSDISSDSSSITDIHNSLSDSSSSTTGDSSVLGSANDLLANSDNSLEATEVSKSDSETDKKNDNEKDENEENIKNDDEVIDVNINIQSSSSTKNILKADGEDTIIYVSPFGPDDGDGSMLRSYNTIQKALDSITDDGHYTIVLRNGVYTGIGNTRLNINKSNITIKAYDKAKPVIEFYNTSTSSSYMGWNITGSSIDIQGITFNSTYGQSAFLRILNTDDVNVSDCKFGNTSASNPAINVTGSNNVKIENSDFYKLNMGSSSSIISALRSNITVSGCDFEDSSSIPIRLNYTNADISNNNFNKFTSNYLIYSENSNSTISGNTFENRTTNNVNARAALYIGSNSNSNISGNSFKNINNSYSGASGYSTIYTTGSNVNISDNDFIDNYAYNGGAINIAGSNNVIENNRFTNTNAYYGGAIYNSGTNLTLRNNTISNSDATQGKKIYNSGTINTVNVTFMNNETITTDAISDDITILVTDDMGNEIHGKTVPVKLNDDNEATVNIVEGEANLTISNPGVGVYLVNGNYTGALNSNVKTGVLEFLEPYNGPFYVSENGSDNNDGDENHPFATIEHAIKAASQSENVHAIFINEGTYFENNLTVPTGMNITGLGDVTIDGKNGGRILSVNGSDVNITNIGFANANYTNYSSANGGAVYWTGANGTLNDAKFSNNTARVTGYNSGNGGAVYWSGANGIINNTVFEDNLMQTSSYAANGGAVYWNGVNGTISNSTFNNNIANSSSVSNRNGGAVYWAGQNGQLLDNTFDSNNAYNGATIYNNAQNLTLKNNEISNPDGTTGKYIYTNDNYGSINGAVLTILNNSTVNTTRPSLDCLITVTDDMGNPIYGGYLNVTLNGTDQATANHNNENITVKINSPGQGEYLVDAKYYHSSATTANDNYISKTGVLNWTDEPYNGPFYVAENGNDNNRGDEDHPFATLDVAIKAASMTNAVPAIYVKEGTYKENDLNITKPMNITGLGNVVIDGENQNEILNVSANKVNISNINFINGNSPSDGGAIYWSGNNGTLKDSTFANNTASGKGGSIYNSGNNLTLSGNTISDSNASIGKSIYNDGSINGATLVLLNNDTVVLPEGQTATGVSVKLVDDMGNPIAGGFVNITLNDHKAANMQNLTDDLLVTVFSPAYGEYLVNGSYRTTSTSSRDLNNYTVQTGSLTFLAEPYFGPYYVAENGSDYNDGSPDHPFATIEQAIEAASQEDVVPAIFINEGVYNESNLNITKPMNITGLGDVIINANNSGYGLDVKADNVNVSNVEFANGNKTGSGAAVTWEGDNGSLTNVTFVNNTASENGGAVQWIGENGTLINSTFINNTAEDRGGAIVYQGNLNLTNNTFINNSAVHEGGAIFTNVTAPLEIANSTFINNSAKNGGAVFVDYSNNDTNFKYDNTGVNITDSSFINNTAKSGGAVVLYSSNATVSNSTFIGNNATEYGDGAISSGGENNTIINNTFINNTASDYAGAIGSNGSAIINNTFINNSAYHGGAIMTVNDTIINNTFIGNNATIGPAIVYLQNYNLTNGTDNYTVLINNTLPEGSVKVYDGDVVLNVTANYNGHYFVSIEGYYDLGASAYCLELNNSKPWAWNGTTGMIVHDLSFIRNSLDGSYVGDYVRVAILLHQSLQSWNIKELIHNFTDGDYMNSDDPEIQRIIEIANDDSTVLINGDNWINGEWYCGSFDVLVHPTTRQTLIILNGCGDYFELPKLTPNKEANVTTVQDEDYINYTVNITNDGDVWLHNITVKDIPDSALTFIDWENSIRASGIEESWIKDNESLTWYLNRTLLPGESAIFNVIFKADVSFRGENNTAYDIFNKINVSSHETNWQEDEAVVKALSSYLVIRKDTLDTNVSVGEVIRFLITVTNIGEGPANIVEVEDASWASYGLTYIGWADGYHNRTWSIGNSSHHWYLNGPLAPSESASILVMFNATNPGTMFPNTAIVYNPDGPTNVATNYTNISYVYLGAYKTVVDIKDDIITFALTVSNNGNATAHYVYISESNSYTMPLVNWTDSRGAYMNSHWNYNGPSTGSYFNSATWTLQDPLGPGGTATILLTLNTTYATGYSNSITVGDIGGSKNGTGTNGPLIRYLGAYKTVVDQTGDIITFALTVTNQGNITAHNVYIIDSLSTYGNYGPMKLINWTDSRGAYMNSHWYYSGPSSGSGFSGSVRWELQDPLGPGGSATILVNLNTSDASSYGNSITVGEKNGFTNGTGLGGPLTRYLGAYKTVLEVKDDILQFMITVTNNGNITAHDAYILDSLSNYGLTFINWTDSRGPNYNYVWNTNFYTRSSTNYYNFTYKNPLGPGGTASVIMTFNTTNATGYSNGISVGEKNGFGNGTGVGGPLTRYLGAYKTVLEQEGDTIKFLLTVTNNGNITANEVRIQDQLYRGLVNGRSANLTYIGWEDPRGPNFNSDWSYGGFTNSGNFTYYNWTFLKPLKPGGSASIVVIFNTSNATAYSNGMSVYDKHGFGNGTGVSGNITRAIGAYKTVVDIKDDIITFALTVSNNGNTTLTDVYIYENPGGPYMDFVKWEDVRGSYYNSDWYYSGPGYGNSFTSANWRLYDGLKPLESRTILLTLNTTKAGSYSNGITVRANDVSNGTGLGGPLTRYLGAYKTVLEQKDDTVTFMLTVTNQGNITAHDVYIQDSMYGGMPLISWTDSRGPSMNSHWYYSPSSSGGNFTGAKWTLQDPLGPGGSASIILTLNTSYATSYSNGISVYERNGFGNGTGTGNGIYRYLTATKIALNNNTAPGDIVRFRLIVTNIGNTTSFDVYLKDIFIDESTLVSWNDTRGSQYNSKWTFLSDETKWTYSDPLNPGAYLSIDVDYKVTESGNHTNTLIVGDRSGIQNGTIVNISVAEFNPSFEIIKIANDEYVYVGNTTSYTIIVNNTGDTNLNHFFIDEIIPEGLEYVRYENTSGNWFICRDKWVYDGVLEPGQTAELTIIFNTTKSGVINNTVIGGSDETPNKTADNNTTVVYGPSLAVEKLANVEYVLIGDLIEYTITVTNDGDCDMKSVFAKEQIPSGLVYVDYRNKTGSWIYDGVDTWTYDGTLAVGESAEFVIIFNTSKSGNLTNVIVVGSNDLPGPIEANDTVEVFTPEFEVRKIANDEYVYAGNTTSYTISVKNTGDCNLTNIKIKEEAPEGIIFVEYINKTGSWIYDGVDTWTYDGTLAVGESAEFTVVYNTTKSMVINNTVVASTEEIDNVTVFNNTTIVLSPKLTVQKIALNESVFKSHLAHFMIVVSNTGDCDLTKVFVEDTWPEGLIGVGFLDDTGKWFNHGNKWVYDGELKVGESTNFTVIFYANASGNYTNIVTAGSNITGNVTANASTTVYSPSFDVNKTANDEIVHVGNTTSYTITITNTGDINLTDIFIDEIAPEDIEYIDYINRTGRWIYEGVLQPGETAEIVLIFNTTESGRIKNRLIAGSNETPMQMTENNTTVVDSPSLDVQKISNNETVYKGNLSEFTIIVRNTGDCDLTGVFVKEVIPNGLSYVSFKDSTGKWSYNKKTNTFNYKGALGVNKTAQFTVVFNTTKAGKLTNTVIAGSNISGNASANNTTTVLAPSLEVQKITLNQTVNSGEQTQFLIIVTNNGDCDLTGVYVIEKSFPGLKYGSYVDKSGKWVFDGKNKWTYKGVLKPGESASFIVVFDTDKVGNFTNTVVAGSDITGEKEAKNITEVIKKSNDTQPNGTKHVKTKLTYLESIKAGNPLFALLVVLTVLGILPIYRKRD